MKPTIASQWAAIAARDRRVNSVGSLRHVLGRLGGEVVRQVAQRVVGAGLVGDDVGVDAVGQQTGQDVGGVAHQPDRQRRLGARPR
jgi:hypothetical protein